MNRENIMDEDRKDMIIRFLNRKTSLFETEDLRAWIDELPENRAMFDDYYQIWKNTERKGYSNFDTKAAWEKTCNQIEGNKQTDKGYAIPIKHKINSWLKYAAIAMVIFMSGALLSLLIRDNQIDEHSNEITEIVMPKGSKSNIFLPDGTEVWLNAGSKLSYRKDYNEKERILKLEGEAFFKVAHNPSKPFIVNTSHLNIKALGTSFNVKAYLEENTIETTLVEGSVAISGLEKEKENKNTIQILKPKQTMVFVKQLEPDIQPKTNEASSQQIEIDSEKTPEAIEVKDNIKTELYTSWKDKRWIVDGKPLKELAVMLERRFDITVQLGSEELAEYKFSGIIENETIEQVLEILKLTTPIHYEMGKGKVTWQIDSKLREKYAKILKN